MPLPSLHLYSSPTSCSLAALILLHELSLPFTSTTMRMLPLSQGGGLEGATPGGPTREEYLSINPKGLIPALRVTFASSTKGDDDGKKEEVITELPAILTYLCLISSSTASSSSTPPSSSSSADHSPLLGTTPLARARVAEWLTWLSGTLHGQGFGAMWRPARFAGAEHEEVHEVISEKGRELVGKCFLMVEEGIRGERFVMGEEEGFTVVDLYLYVFWRWGYRIGKNMGERFPRWGRVMRETEGRGSVLRALAEGGLERVF